MVPQEMALKRLMLLQPLLLKPRILVLQMDRLPRIGIIDPLKIDHRGSI